MSAAWFGEFSSVIRVSQGRGNLKGVKMSTVMVVKLGWVGGWLRTNYLDWVASRGKEKIQTKQKQNTVEAKSWRNASTVQLKESGILVRETSARNLPPPPREHL